MSSRPAQRTATSRQPQGKQPAAPQKPRQVHEIVHPVWVAKMLGVMLVLALICAQLLVGYVFYKTQWQYVLKPSHEVATTPAAQGLAFEDFHFGVDNSGQPQLDGWWVPAAATTANTALVLHSGDGSMSDAIPSAKALHDAGLNVLLFDYRGYGRSLGRHPSQELMQADAESALSQLISTRGIAAKHIVVFGIGAGASLAAELGQQHTDLAGLILLNGDGDFRARVQHDRRVRVVPVGLLFNQDFPLAAPLANLAMPKLLITTNSSHAPEAFAKAHDPKTTVELDAGDNASLHTALVRFLDQVLGESIPPLTK